MKSCPTRRAVFDIVCFGLSIPRAASLYGLREVTLRKNLDVLEREGFIRRVDGVYPIRYVYSGAGEFIRENMGGLK